MYKCYSELIRKYLNNKTYQKVDVQCNIFSSRGLHVIQILHTVYFCYNVLGFDVFPENPVRQICYFGELNIILHWKMSVICRGQSRT